MGLLGMRLPLKVDSSAFQVLSLVMHDFDIITTPRITAFPFIQSTVFKDPTKQRELAILFIAKSQLCAQIEEILKAEYEVRMQRPPHMANVPNRMLLYPKTCKETESVERLDRQLVFWEASLPDICTYRSPVELPDPRDPTVYVIIHQTILSLVHQAVIATLHRPNAKATARGNPAAASSSQLSNLRVVHATNSIAHMAADLGRLCLDGYLPSAAVTALLPAILTLITQWRESNSDHAR
ncbi:hypothetical protein FOTG_13405 [Fusarium oxysporum f. sp. vasinfectum 25433]|uniref:Cutinase transcription factor 1 beta n=1 Tax=Fusarium oxysporum f. sp. vasinfectum 25433 TaxID=1089449 RepID=X0LBK2_FUSOX|nr:hypothetical protein FOTG_13405 [Fusarium oxysporum f. sp. vasinfectum 25433]